MDMSVDDGVSMSTTVLCTRLHYTSQYISCVVLSIFDSDLRNQGFICMCIISSFMYNRVATEMIIHSNGTTLSAVTD